MRGKLREWVYVRTDAVLRSVLKNGGWAASAQIAQIAGGLVETFLFARLLPITTFGTVLVLTAAVDLLYGILDFRSGEAVIKYVPEQKRAGGAQAVSSFLRIILAADLGVAAIGLILLLVLQSLIFRWVSVPPEYGAILAILAVGAGCKAAVRSLGSYLRVTGRFPLSMKIGMAAPLLRLALILALVLASPTAGSVAWSISAAECAFAAAMAVAAFLTFRGEGVRLFKMGGESAALDRRDVIRFMISNNLAGTLRVLSTKLDVMLIASLASTGAVAIYKVAGRLAGFLLMFSDPLLVAIYPEMSHLHAENRMIELKRLLKFLTRSFFVIAFIVVCVSALAGKWLLSTFLGMQYIDCYAVMLIMMLGTASAMIFFWARPLLLVRGMATTLLGIAAVSLTVQLVTLYLFTPAIGVAGAGISFALGYICTVGLYLVIIGVSGKERGNRLPSTVLPERYE